MQANLRYVQTADAVERTCAALRELLGDDGVLTGAALAARPIADWSDAPSSCPAALLLPRTPAQVAGVLAICHHARQPVAIQGGLTGLAGGANVRKGEFALSLQRLQAIEDFDSMGGTVVVEAGVTLEQLQSVAAERGWSFPLDLGARGSCQLGGNAATNAGGNRVLRHGMMRQSVLGLEVALTDGTLLPMLGRVIKDNAGFDLKHLFIGSEGCLGVITRLALKLEPSRPVASTVLCGMKSFDDCSLLLKQAKSMLAELSAFELMWQDFFEAAAKATGRALPFGQAHALYVLIEAQGPDAASAAAAVERFLVDAMDKGIVEDAIVAQSVEQAAQLWSYREAVSKLLSMNKPFAFAAFDVSVEMPVMEALVGELREHLRSKYPECSHLFFGHLGDGNLHLISGPYAGAAELDRVEHAVYRCVGRYGGSISAEHGVGTVKKAFLHNSRGVQEIALMRKLKQMLDPHQILNPGRVLDGEPAS